MNSFNAPNPSDLPPDHDIDPEDNDELITTENYAAQGETAGVTTPQKRAPVDVRVSRQSPLSPDERKNGPGIARLPENLDLDALGYANVSGWPWTGSR